MTASVGFTSFLILTSFCIALVVLTGVRGRRKSHFSLVACLLVLLGMTVFYAEKLGEEYNLETAGMITPIHLTLAKATVLSYLLPLISGFMTLRDIRKKALHFKLAMFVIAMTTVTFVTGLMMILSAEPIVAS